MDAYGRTLLLRGVNLSGSSKIPLHPNGATHLTEGFFDHRNVSFVGRPFPLEDAYAHFRRLRSWGLTLLRLLVTWEAVEHAGPGLYDEEYLDYLAAVVGKAGEHGFTVVIDPHQDVWSRLSGGDGAPGWTFEAAGMDPGGFFATGAAITHQCHGDPLPHMIWTTNNFKLASSSMFTFFFAGNELAPMARAGGEPVQELLQRGFISAMTRVASRLSGMDCVAGYGVLNEPSPGYIGCRDLAALPGLPRIGDTLSPLDSMALGAGIPRNVRAFRFGIMGSRRIGTRTIDPRGSRAWLPGRDCIWRDHGVWDIGSDGEPRILHPDYFRNVNGRAVDFDRDYYVPFIDRYIAAIRAADPKALIFLEPTPFSPPPERSASDAEGIVYAPHWYDSPPMMLRRFMPFLGADPFTIRPIFGPRRIRRAYAAQIRGLEASAARLLPGAPTLIGECGTPFNSRAGTDVHAREVRDRAMNRTMCAMDDACISCVLWNYTPDNTHERGDQWNGEDFSIFCGEETVDPGDIDSGGRALRALVRPYARATAGEPLSMTYDIRSRVFEYVFRHDPAARAPTVIFLPALPYPNGVIVEVSDGRHEVTGDSRELFYFHSPRWDTHRIRVRPASDR